ncbi:hypothetical protein ACHHYP_08287 [Achlya hypogyna]|uniref:Secreted protein n=1 Tax=Achlya hypogyna TaxID=1202772 RepID=A0A1V9ZKS3_ACHHY|nr:hypothetical protein ACHHYP_08287 [Achlya hypogyna]
MAGRERRAWCSWLLVLLYALTVRGNQLLVISQPATMTAGDMLSPPVLQIVDDTGLVLSDINTGTVTVSIETNPLMYAVLSGTSGLAFPIVAGVVTCSGLSINLVASGYTLSFVALSYGLQTSSNPFDIILGPPYQLSMYTYIGVAQGGTPFSPQPTVAIVDKGGNLVASVSSGSVSVAILNNPVGGILTPAIAHTVYFYEGFGKFYDLQIDKAGGPYTLKFTCDASLNLPGGNSYTTFPFTVAIGPPRTMFIAAYPLAAFGGEAFVTQPMIQLLDAGGNTLQTQPSMQIAATIYANPSGGRLYPATETSASVINGFASFKNLRIDLAGNNYMLRFAITMLNVLGVYAETGLAVVGPSLNVYLGALFSLQVLRPPESAIADGQPFYTQPVLVLRDRGNNTISTENLALVSVSMVPSLALYNNLIVSTANSPIATITDVTLLFSPFSAPFGAGTDLFINVTFSQQIMATGSIVLQMNSAPGALATCNTLLTWSNRLTFGYGITAGDAAAALNYASTSALTLQGGATLVDRLGVPASLILPAAGLRPAVVVDTTAPSIVSVGCVPPFVAGTYGPGQVVSLLVTFSAPVSIYSTLMPYLLLNTLPAQSAIYSSGNQTASLVFQYIVGPTDAVATLDVVAALNTNGGLLRRAGTALKQDALLQMPATASSRLPAQCPLVISSVVPAIDATVGVTSATPNGVYATGDRIFITVPFTALVAVSGIPLLALNTGRNAAYSSGSGSSVLTFQYIVQAGDSVAALDYASPAALMLNAGTIQRFVTAGSPLLDVNIDLTATTASNRNLGQTAALVLNGLAPTVVSVAFPVAPTTYTRGGTVAITVTFSYAVVVQGQPSILLNTGVAATYASGSGSTALVFNYRVQLGDATTDLAYAPTSTIVLNGGSILQQSSTPSLAAQLMLPWPPAIVNAPVTIDPALTAVTTVVSITADQVAGEYGQNQVIQITVTFSDAVQIVGGVRLALTTQTVAYASGSGTKALVFLYIVQPNDATSSLNIASASPFTCTAGGGCSIANANYLAANLDCTGLTLQPTAIVINTVAPSVVSVAALTPAPTINRGTFVVGDLIQILIVVSKAVDVQPSPSVFPTKVPTLLLNTGQVAYFTGYDNGDRTRLLFQYTVAVGDATPNLQYASTGALTLNYNQASIRRLATNPTTPMNLLLPVVANLGTNLVVDTSRTPIVINVASITADGTYFVGDVIAIRVTFSEYVVVSGIPVLLLNLGVYDRSAVYVSGSGSTSLVFQYTIGQDDFSKDLSYIDLRSLYNPPGASILFQSTNPTVAANCQLPLPGSAGSLSANSNLQVLGGTPYIVDIAFLSPNATYTVDNTIDVQVTFSAKVVVSGTPFLRMASGPSLRQAFYVPTVGASTTVVFRYRVQTGDVSMDLDYADTAAIQLNGGSILTAPTLLTSIPVQPANLQLNPPGGALTGTRTVQTVAGVVNYVNLGIDTMGLGYIFYFATATVVTSVQFDVTYSAVWEVRNAPLNEQNRGDRTGSSVDITTGVAVVGSAGAKARQYNVQVVTASGSATKYVNEIQYVQTTCVQRDAIQVLTSSAAPGSTLGGYFTLMLGAEGPTRRLAYNFDATQLKVALELDFGFDAAAVEVTRTPNTFCGCFDAYAWTITFHTDGEIPTLLARSYLTGVSATVGDGTGGASALVLSLPPVVNGQFALRYGALVTASMPSNVDATTMANRLTTDLNLPILSVQRSLPTVQAGYTWSITFYASATIFNPNELEPAPLLLTGNQVLLSVTTVQEGQAPLYGNFRLSIAGHTTPNIAVTASAGDVQTALQTLPEVTSVAVTRSAVNPSGGYSWTITFLQINLMSTYGLVLNSLGTLPPLTPMTLVNGAPILMGTSATIMVNYAGVNPSANSPAGFGNAPGESAGSVTIFVPRNLQWIQSANLLGSDTQSGDNFGAAVAINTAGTQVDRGRKEIQTLTCTADGGSFTLTFLGITSPPISFAATAATLQAAIARLLNVPLSQIAVSTYTNLCAGIGVAVTFATPDLSTETGNVPNLVPDGSSLTSSGGPGSIVVQEIAPGTYRLDGTEAKGATCGGAYFYQASAGMWSQMAKMLPMDGSEGTSSEFGASVALENTYAVVGAPAAADSVGEAYVYIFNGLTWSFFQKLTCAPYAGTKGDRFGEVVKVSGSTIAISAPGYASNLGAVFVYKLVSGVFLSHEKIQAGDLSAGDRFGSAIALDMAVSTLVVGTERQATATGAVYVYYSRDVYFALQQKLQGSDTRVNDGFGHSVAVVRNVLLVGANANFGATTPLTTRKAVQSIVTSATSPIRAGSTFLVGFRQFSIGFENDYVMSTPIPFDASAVLLQVILQRTLNTGALVVTRLGPDANNGYTWYVTFAGSTAAVTRFAVDGTGLKGSNADVAASVLVAVPPIVRSNTYVFTRTGTFWREQATLRPTNKQYFSLFGHSVALSRNGYHAAVGAPNADTLFTGVNSGAGYVFDLGFLDFQLSASAYSVLEGGTISIPVQRCGPLGLTCTMKSTSVEGFIDLDTGDAVTDRAGTNNVPSKMLKYIGPYQQLAMLDMAAVTSGAKYYPGIWGPEPYPQVPMGRYLLPSWVGTAESRAQFYGSAETRSLWIDSQFDYQGHSDYTPTDVAMAFAVNSITSTALIQTTDDMVFEYPDETINVRLSVPGMWPSYPSQFWSQITILDNGDGGFGTKSYTAILLSSATAPVAHGTAVALLDAFNLAAVGEPGEVHPTTRVACGAVLIYLATSGIWALEATLRPPTCIAGSGFGTSVAIDGSYGTVRLVVGAPSALTPTVFVYVRNSATATWNLETAFTEPAAASTSANYGGSYAVDIFGYNIVVGASGLECTFVYTYTTTGWLPAVVLRANDYATDVVYLQNVVHEFEFGAAVSIGQRSIVVGAPRANYGTSRQLDTTFLGTGAAYVYYLPAQVQTITLNIDVLVTAGQFVLSLGGASTSRLNYAISDVDMTTAIQALIPSVQVTRAGTTETGFTWRVTILSEVTTVPLLVATWRGYGCSTCIAFNTGYTADPGRQVDVTSTAALGTWTFHQRLTAADGNRADRFGAAVDLDGDSIIIGAYGSFSLTTTTWDFETGDLTGWVQTGTAFGSQPTFGENVRARASGYLSSYLKSASGILNFEGRYWVGTYEARPGAGRTQQYTPFSCAFMNDDCKATGYTTPDSSIAGSAQGDGPMGTLTSQPFSILGSAIRFRIGGGCNLATVYVELLVDGLSVRKATGRCRESLHRVAWNVTAFTNRTGQIRIVDDTDSVNWGHINVDDFQFDWPVQQPSTEKAGAAYVFYRSTSTTSYGVCQGVPKLQCAWMLQARLVASDKRDHDMFGFSVGINDALGMAVIGAYGQSIVNLNNSIAGGDDAGSLYLFIKTPALLDGVGSIITPQRWPAFETAKLQAVNKAPNAQFGYALSQSNGRVAVGSPGMQRGIGTAYVLDTQFIQVSFASDEVAVNENDVNGQAIVVLYRAGDTSAPLTIEYGGFVKAMNKVTMLARYATSDLTGAGVDATRFAQCMAMPIQNRIRCGRYQQTSGVATFPVGGTSLAIAVPIMNDWCYAEGQTHVAFHLNPPGGDVILGEQFTLRIRIDDDDFGRTAC